MHISYYNYQRMHEFIRKDIRKELETLLAINNDEGLFYYQYRNEKLIGKTLGRGYCRGTHSGTAALQLALTALGIGKGDEVITVPNSYIATALAISNTGATPVFVDIDPNTMLMDLKKMQEAITEKTKVILPVHLYGQMLDMKHVCSIAKKHALLVVEDAAHAHLASYDGKRPGHYSDAACYSLFINKGFGGISDGGMILTKHRFVAKKVDKMRSPDCNDPYVLNSLRTPCFLPWDQIAFIKSKLSHVNSWVSKRKEYAKRYFEGLSQLPLDFQKYDRKTNHVFRDFVILYEKRDKLKRYLRRKNIETIIHYPTLIHLTKTYRHLGYKKGDLPISEQVNSKVLSIPISPFLDAAEHTYVVQAIRSFF